MSRLFTLACLSWITLSLSVVGQELPTEIDSDRVGRLKTGGNVILRNGTVHTVSGDVLEKASILVVDGKIEKILPGDIEVTTDMSVIDCTGMHITPGIIDCHSHIATSGGTNESGSSITAEVRISDEVNGDDVSIFRALAGGCTTANLLHGSANAIGGQNAIIKLKYRRPAEDLLFPGAPRGVKFALGENPKRSSSSGGRWESTRYPSTRMGVEAVIRRAFVEAQDYVIAWGEYEKAVEQGENPLPPRRDVRLEVLADILSGEVRVHCHCYRNDEILMLIRIADEFGFQIATFQHVLEGYKVAPEMAAHGVGGSTFSDWWAYKIEAYEAIPYNAALMHDAGVVVSLNSDSSELMRRLNLEAAKAVKYGGVNDVDALAMVTLSPARQLGIDEYVGSIEVGKHADLAVWNADPLSVYSRCEWTLVDGEVEFQREGHPTASTAPIRNPLKHSDDEGEGEDHTSGSGDEAEGSDENLTSVGEVAEEVAEENVLVTVPIKREVQLRSRGVGNYAIVDARIIPVTSPPIEKGTVLVSGGRIEALGADLDVPDGYSRIEGKGLSVYPGMIDPGTQLGLTEISSVSGTVDTREQGSMQADLRVAVAINPDSAHIPVARVNGITSAVVKPRGSLIGGQSALVRLDGWTWEEMVRVDPLALHIATPGSSRRGRWGRWGSEEPPADDPRTQELIDIFDAAREYAKKRTEAESAGATPPPRNPRLEAIVPYAEGLRPVIFDANDEKAIEKAIDVSRKLGVRPIISGGREAWKVAGLLKENDVPVFLGPVLSNPSERHDPYDAQYANAAVLHRAGVRFAIQTNDEADVRNLPYHAGMSAAYGLPKDEALASVTIRAAEILGVDGELGSLEPGKIADLVVTDGDLLEIRTSIKHLFISGRPVELDTLHTRLYERYRARSPEPGLGGR